MKKTRSSAVAAAAQGASGQPRRLVLKQDLDRGGQGKTIKAGTEICPVELGMSAHTVKWLVANGVAEDPLNNGEA